MPGRCVTAKVKLVQQSVHLARAGNVTSGDPGRFPGTAFAKEQRTAFGLFKGALAREAAASSNAPLPSESSGMNVNALRIGVYRSKAGPASLLGLCLSLLVGGCPSGPSGGDGNEPPAGQDVTAEIVSPSSSFGISVLDDQAITVLYSVVGEPDDISGFYVPVADGGTNAAPIGDPIVIAMDLDAGTNQFFSFVPSSAGVGFYRVGVLVTVGSEQMREESTGIIQVEGPPTPHFILPDRAIMPVVVGGDVRIKFDAGDPEDEVQWRLFYLKSTDSLTAPVDQLGTQLGQPGSGNQGEFIWNLGALPVGDYRLGLSATDSGFSIAGTVDREQLDRIVTIPNDDVTTPIIRVVAEIVPMPPTLTFTAPGASDVSLFRNQAYSIQFTGKINELNTTGTIEIFRDSDRLPANGFTLLASELSPSTTSLALPTNLPEGTYNIGGTIRDGINSPVTTYATGKITVIRTVTLSVTEPNSELPIKPGTPVNVKWTTNAPSTSGKVDVVAQRVTATGTTVGAEIPILTNAALTVTSATFTPSSTGLFEIIVRIRINDGTSVEDSAPDVVRVTTLPTIVWLGTLASPTSGAAGAIFGGANYEDNAGTSLAPAGDLNSDGNDDFLIAARYGKPGFVNPTGVGPGEAYLIFGKGGNNRLRGLFNLNSAGNAALPGVTFAGIRTPQDSNETEGLTSLAAIPDVDGDQRPEIVFGFPLTASRGHNIHPQQNGVVPPYSLPTLEREDQFKRGGIVFVSSTNSLFSSTSSNAVMQLDMVGQDFLFTCVDIDPDAEMEDGEFSIDVFSEVPDEPSEDNLGCEGDCRDPQSGGTADATEYVNFGFVSALARDYFTTFVYTSELFGGLRECDSAQPFRDHECLQERVPPVFLQYCNSDVSGCPPFSPGLHRASTPDGPPVESVGGYQIPAYNGVSGFYVRAVVEDNVTTLNRPFEPFGARVIGVGMDDRFGTSISVLSNQGTAGRGDIVVSAPGRTARGILLGPTPGGCTDPPNCGGEIDGLETSLGAPATNPEAGVAYLFPLRSLWTTAGGGQPPRPHQYIVGEASHCAGPNENLTPNVEAVRIAGFAGDRITNITGIGDLNGDGRDDFAIAAPNFNGGQGRVYIAFRRAAGVEGDYVLEKLARDPNDPGRLDGMLIVADGTSALGASMVSGVDFDKDGLGDLIIGGPSANGGIGELVILFGGSDLVTPLEGITVSDLLEMRQHDGRPVAARIIGNPLDTTGMFGFNVANAGDVDGDGTNDLLVAAPNATPRFDPNPNDGDDTLTEPGVDVNLDWVRDTVAGGSELHNAGIVYVIYGKNRLDQLKTCSGNAAVCDSNGDCPSGQTCQTTNMTINIDQLGTDQLDGLIIAGRRTGDQIGGGDAGDVAVGGNPSKTGRGRSFGLASAGDVDGDGRVDILIGSVLADPRRDPNSGIGLQNGGEAYLVYGSNAR